MKKEFDIFLPKWYIRIQGVYHAHEFVCGKGKSRSEAS
jgi:hypothetical protein